MKIITGIIVFLITMSGSSKAQMLGGFFSQQETKVKVMLQQIAGYQIYLNELKSGYSTAQDGLNTMHSLKNGTYSLHQNYFKSLDHVAPSVKNNPKIKGITDLQQQIIATFDAAISWQKDKQSLSDEEIIYMQSVYSHLLTDCGKDIDELSLVASDNQTQMTDEERIHKIDQLYTGMQSKYSFSRAFCDKAYRLSESRKAGTADKQALRKLYDLN